MKFKDFQAPALFSSTFKALNLGEKSSTLKDTWEPVKAIFSEGFTETLCTGVYFQ